MTQWRGNAIHITGPVWGESTNHSQRVSNAGISRFLRCQVAQERMNIALMSRVRVTPFGYGQVNCPAVFPTQSALLWLTVASQLWGATSVFFGFDFYLFRYYTTLFLYIGVLASTSSECFLLMSEISFEAYFKCTNIHVGVKLEYGLYGKYRWSWKLLVLEVSSVITLMFPGMIDANILKGTVSCTGLLTDHGYSPYDEQSSWRWFEK